MRILIAEDEIQLAKGLKYLLEKNKFLFNSDGLRIDKFIL